MPEVGLVINIRRVGQEALQEAHDQIKQMGQTARDTSSAMTELSKAELARAEAMFAARTAAEQGTSVLQELAEGVRTATADFKAGIISQEQYAEALQLTRDAAIQARRDMGSSFGANTKDLASFASVMGTTTMKQQAMTGSSYMLRNVLAVMGAEALGTSGMFGRLASGALLFGAGGAIATGVIATVASLAIGIQATGQRSEETAKSIAWPLPPSRGSRR